ncbi:hypothetical protein ACA910_008278 [Epithemia clementina (nom. ined.)]
MKRIGPALQMIRIALAASYSLRPSLGFGWIGGSGTMSLRLSGSGSSSRSMSFSSWRPFSAASPVIPGIGCHRQNALTTCFLQSPSRTSFSSSANVATSTAPLRRFSTGTKSSLTTITLACAPTSPSSPTTTTTNQEEVVTSTQPKQPSLQQPQRADDKVVAEGEIVSQFYGLVAVRVLDSDWTAPTETAGLTATPPPPPPPPSALVVEQANNPPTTIAAATTEPKGKFSKASAAVTGGDLQGRIVLFPNSSGDEPPRRGVVVAHRPPIVFVYSVDGHYAGDSSQTEAKADNTRVQILNNRMEIPVPDSPSDKALLDCVGTPILKEGGEQASSLLMSSSTTRSLFSPTAQVKEIALINVPMLTGITMFDSLAPIGRGQNMLFVGHDVEDMRKYAVDFMANQLRIQSSLPKDSKENTVACVYAAIDNAAQVETLLEQQNIRQSVHVVTPTSAAASLVASDAANDDEFTKASKAVLAAATACAIAESLALEKNAHTIVVVDTMDSHKTLWDGTTRVLVDIFGVDAVVRGDREGSASSEMRAFYSTLVQRAAQYNKGRGGGSITLLLLTKIPRIRMEEDGDANEKTVFDESDFENSSNVVKERIKLLTKRNIPLTADTLRKINIPIPSASEGKRRLILQHVDDLISMSDGQIWLDEKLEMAGQRPPLDPQRSFTRVGIGADTESRADAPALRRSNVEGLRLILSQAASALEGGADATSSRATQKQIRQQQGLLLAMHQTSGTGGRTLAESCAVLLAAANGYLDSVVVVAAATTEQSTGVSQAAAGNDKSQALIHGLLQHLHKSQPEVMSQIDRTMDLLPDQKEVLLESIKEYVTAEAK